jgi:hypothetical protein
MSDKDKATKILKSLGLNPQQVLPHRPAPVVMADGEIRYDLTRRRSTNPEESHRSPMRPKGPSRVHSVEVVREVQETRNSTPVGMMSPRETLPVMGSSAGMVMEGEEEDIWRVSSGRQKRTSSTSNSARELERRARRAPEREYIYQSETQSRAYSPMNPPPSYSPVQHMQHAHPQYYQQHVAPTHIHQTSHVQHSHPAHSNSPLPPPAPPVVPPNPGQATLTQEEVFKVLAALGIGVPGGPAPATAQPIPPAYGSQQLHHAPNTGPYPPGPYNVSRIM